MLLSPAASQTSLPGGPGFWGRFKPAKQQKDQLQSPPQMALSRQRLLTLAFGDMETIRILPNSFMELENLVRDWLKPPPDMFFALRVPKDYLSFQAARLVAGDSIYLTGEDSYVIATMDVQGLRVEIDCDGPPPPEDEPPPPPPPPVLEMPATFSLELAPGQTVALDTMVNSDELDMARMEDGTTVDGAFWGKLDIVHDGDTHKMEFSGTRINNADNVSQDLMVDSRVLTKLAVAARPPTAKFNLTVLAPNRQYCDVTLSFSDYWKMGVTWPPAEPLGDNKVKYFLQVHPGGGMEHFESQIFCTSIYYEAIPDTGILDPHELVAPHNSFAMPVNDFLRHLITKLDLFGLSIQARTNFMNNNLPSFCAHRNIAYRFMTPRRVAAAVDISVTAEDCVFTRLFLMWRGVTDDELGHFAGAGEKEANMFNWREVIDWSEHSKDMTRFRLLETDVLELT